jgi:hypothetical protein
LFENQIYTIKDLYISLEFKKITALFPDVNDLIEAMNEPLFISLLQSSLKLTYLDNNYKFVFAKASNLSNKLLVMTIVKEKGSIERGELQDILLSKYGIEGNYSGSYYFDLGLYYSEYTNKVYDSKIRCEQELQNFLNLEEN